MIRNLKSRRGFLSTGLAIGSTLFASQLMGQGPGGAGAAGQGGVPGQPGPAGPGVNPRLDLYLNNWEQAMTKINSLEARLKLIEVDKVFGNKSTSLGIAKYTKVGAQGAQNSLALLELVKEQKPTELDKKYICTGTYLYEILPATKQIKAHEMPKPKPGQVGDDNFLLFLFGMKAQEIKRRYNITLSREDDHYGYFDILPINASDRADFQKAQLVLGRQNALPRRVWFVRPNGDETLWDLEKIDTNANVAPAEFQAPQLPQGWTSVVNQLQQVNGPARMPRAKP